MSKRKRSGEIFHKSVPALAAYIERIGATEINFRRYVVERETDKGYREDTVVVRLKQNGEISVWDASRSLTKEQVKKDYEPTTEEADAIKAALKDIKLPESIVARKGVLPDELKKVDPSEYYIFSDLTSDQGTVFIQQRKQGKDLLTKIYLPWTFFSDGRWRNMEPDGGLPIYGQERLRSLKVFGIMIHEGAKAARHAQEIVDNKGTDHPWYEELTKWIHVGWIGGAANPHRTDWLPIFNTTKGVRLALACDNDRLGVEAVQYISQTLGRKLKYIKYDQSTFPPSWDMADELPKDAKPLKDYLRPATWATEPVYPKDRKGPPSYEIRGVFTEEWWCIVTPSAFIHRDNIKKMLIEQEFNKQVAPFSHVGDVAKLLSKSNYSQCAGVTYLPGKPPGEVTVGKETLINTHEPSDIKSVKGDPRPFLRFMRHLIPNKSDRKELLRWVATLIARPDIKILYSVLLISEQTGVGKGTLGEKILAKIIGEDNASFPEEEEIVESPFNYWCSHKRLAVVHEIYAGQSWKAYNKLKSKITDRHIDINKKYFAVYRMENWLHIFACSNSMQALKMTDEDRRWFVPEVSEEKRPIEYWSYLNKWLEKENGLSIIKWWAEKFIEKHGHVALGRESPMTARKQKMIDESRSDEDQIAYDLGLKFMEFAGKDKIVIAINDVLKYIDGEMNNKAKWNKAPGAIKALCRAGMKQPKRRGKEHQRFKIDGINRSYIVANFEIEAEAMWDSLKEFYRPLKDLGRL